MPKRLLECIRRAALLRDGGGLSDGQLLALFVKQRDGDAFEAMVNRHGPMVLGVCRRVLRNRHDAEDAFQATFLIFARKAGSIHAQDSVAGWLYRVAYRAALEARARIARRHGKERQVNEFPHPTVEPEDGPHELLHLLDKELDRLPDKYRVPVVLCELEGRSRKEAACLLGLPEGTLSWRLAHAKKLLARRMSGYGAAAVAALLAESAASACLAPALRISTAKAALSAGTVPAKVLAITEGVMKAMLLTKLKITVCAAALMLAAGIGATGLSYRATADQPTQSVASRSQADELEALRLEIEALRKSLQATRERVKTLEGEVSSLKGQSSSGRPGVMGRAGPGPQGGRRTQGGPIGAAPAATGVSGTGSQSPGPATSSVQSGTPQQPPSAGQGGSRGGVNPMQPMMQGQAPTRGRNFDRNRMPTNPYQGAGGSTRKGRSDPMSDAEAALKKLRANPGDAQAVDSLERAIKKLKERERPRPEAGSSRAE